MSRCCHLKPSTCKINKNFEYYPFHIERMCIFHYVLKNGGWIDKIYYPYTKKTQKKVVDQHFFPEIVSYVYV